jgi:hypothetical protein
LFLAKNIGDFMKSLTNVAFLAIAILIAAYASLPTAQAQTLPQAGEATVAFKSMTTTQRSCVSFPYADTAYVQLVADVTVANSTSVAVQSSGNGVNFTNGGVLSATVATDTPTVASGNTYTVTLVGKSTCIEATPTNTNPITITAYFYAPPK